MKRKASRTAGQLLSLLTLNRLTELCGGGAAGAAAGAKIHQVPYDPLYDFLVHE